MAWRSSGMPTTGVYFVSPRRMASMAAVLMCSGVSKSGSPTESEITSRPLAFMSRPFCVIGGGAGIAAAIVHYGVLIGLVQGGLLAPVPATLCGYVAGGIVSYRLNRRHTYRSDRPHREAAWRFAIVAGIGFLITFAVMHLLVD